MNVAGELKPMAGRSQQQITFLLAVAMTDRFLVSPEYTQHRTRSRKVQFGEKTGLAAIPSWSSSQPRSPCSQRCEPFFQVEVGAKRWD